MPQTEERVEVVAGLPDLDRQPRQLLAPLGGCSLRAPCYEDVQATGRGHMGLMSANTSADSWYPPTE